MENHSSQERQRLQGETSSASNPVVLPVPQVPESTGAALSRLQEDPLQKLLRLCPPTPPGPPTEDQVEVPPAAAAAAAKSKVKSSKRRTTAVSKKKSTAARRVRSLPTEAKKFILVTFTSKKVEETEEYKGSKEEQD